MRKELQKRIIQLQPHQDKSIIEKMNPVALIRFFEYVVRQVEDENEVKLSGWGSK